MMTSDVLTWIIVALSSIICGDNSSDLTTKSPSLSPNVTAENALSAENRPGHRACSPSPCHPEAVCVSLGEMTDHVSLCLTNILTIGNPCDTTFKPFHNIYPGVINARSSQVPLSLSARLQASSRRGQGPDEARGGSSAHTGGETL